MHTTSLHLWNTKRLVSQLAGQQLTKKERLGYLLAGQLLWAVGSTQSVSLLTASTGYEFVQLAICVVFTVLGTWRCYVANGGTTGASLFERFFVLSVPIGLKIALFVFLFQQTIARLYPWLTASMPYQESWELGERINVVVNSALVLVYYWRLSIHIGRCRSQVESAGRVESTITMPGERPGE